MVLVTRPNHDLPTKYLYSFSQIIVDLCGNKSIGITDLKSKKASKKNFDRSIKKDDVQFIFINGHGNDDVVTGYNNKVLIDKYGPGLKNKVIFARSCRSAKILGKKLVKGGVKAYIGYTKDYYVMMSNDCPKDLVKDKMARLFLEPSNLIAKSIISGDSVKEASNKSKKALVDNIKKVLSSGDQDRHQVAGYLYHDLKCQKVIGRGSYKLIIK